MLVFLTHNSVQFTQTIISFDTVPASHQQKLYFESQLVDDAENILVAISILSLYLSDNMSFENIAYLLL